MSTPDTEQLVRTVGEATKDPVYLRMVRYLLALSIVAGLALALVFTRQASSEKDEIIAEGRAELVAARTERNRAREQRDEVSSALRRYNAKADCMAAYTRRVTETQNVFLTDGLGRLVEVILTTAPPRADEVFAPVVATHQRLREASQRAVEARRVWHDAGEQLPCPIAN